jgi:MFS superfamily sulfate permease-like transporter
MVIIKGFEFSLRELAGSLGDFGTLIPFTVGYIVLCGFDPTGLLVGIGVTNIFLALVYRLPLPVQPKKVIGSVALAEKWSMNRVLGAGFSVGLVWIVLAGSKQVSRLLERVPNSVVRGVQLGLAFTLALSGAELVHENVLFAIPLFILAFLLLRSRFLPASLFLVLAGFLFAVASGRLNLSQISVRFALPSIHTFTLDDVLYGFSYAGFAQLFLTLTNAVVATVSLVHDLFPDRKEILPRNLIANMAIMNMATPFIGGMPLCHGSGGLAAQYLFGARTGGAILMEGLIELTLGLFFSQSLLAIFTAFPPFIIGVMLILTSLELGRLSFKIERDADVVVMLLTAVISTTFNIAAGFVSGLLLYFGLERKIVKLPD